MIRVFIDTSVLFSACLSASGASRELLRLGVRGEVVLVPSDVVEEEARRNLLRKAPTILPLLDEFFSLIPLERMHAAESSVAEALAYTEWKDAPIVAASIDTKVDFLVTLDKVHLLDRVEVAERSGTTIVQPGSLLEILRSKSA